MKEAFISKSFKPDTWEVIDNANDIIADYTAQGFVLTLRQLYYQFVARDLLPNTMQSYNRLKGIVSNARLAGYMDWEAIEDRTRNVEHNSHWDSPKDGIQALLAQYKIDMWENQETRCEVWIEKEALVGVIEQVCRELDVPYFACRGYVSQSEQWRAGRRARQRFHQDGQNTVIIHLGDHDPSGVDMTRDNQDRLKLFAGYCKRPQVVRIALNMDQVEEHEPPPNPAKMTDSRFEGYVAEHGYESWELDALEPSIIVGLIREEVDKHRDMDLWAEKEGQLTEEVATLEQIIEDLEDE